MENAAGNELGMENFKDLLVKHSSAKTVELFHQLLINSLHEFKKEASFTDDVTLLTIRSI